MKLPTPISRSDAKRIANANRKAARAVQRAKMAIVATLPDQTNFEPGVFIQVGMEHAMRIAQLERIADELAAIALHAETFITYLRNETDDS